MRFLRQHQFTLIFLGLLVFCSVMVIRQMDARQSKHVELREAMILLQTGGYTNEAQLLYRRLLNDLDRLTNKELVEDWQRTVILTDPSATQTNNFIWNYHWTVRNAMEKRAGSIIEKARRLAAETQK